MSKLFYCQKCKEYTMKEECSKCGSRTVTPHPAKYSKEDKYAEYRRKAKYGDLK